MTLAEAEFDRGFRATTQTDVDSRRRVSLGKVGRPEHSRYEVFENDLGEILLVPMVSIPAREMIIWENAQVRNSLARGIEQASMGKVVDRGDFTQYLDLPDED